MLPTFALGPWRVRTYSAVYAFAVMVVGMFMFHRTRRGVAPEHYSWKRFVVVLLAAMAGTYAVAIVPTLLRWAMTGRLEWLKRVNWGGTVAGMVLALVLTARWGTRSVARMLDLAILPLPLVLVIGRFGCLAAGCCYGRPTDSWLGMYLPDVVGVWAVRFPTRIISAVSHLLCFIVLLLWERASYRRTGEERVLPFDGALAVIYCLWFCVERFTLEFLRGDYEPWYGPFSWVHLYCAVGFVLALAVGARQTRIQRKGAKDTNLRKEENHSRSERVLVAKNSE